MTYADLLVAISNMTGEQLESNVTVYIPEWDEHFAANLVFATEENDVLDPNHPIIRIK